MNTKRPPEYRKKKLKLRKKRSNQRPPRRKKANLKARIGKFEELIDIYEETKYHTRYRFSLYMDMVNAKKATRRKMEVEIIPILKKITAHELIKELGRSDDMFNLVYPLRRSVLKKGMVKEEELKQSEAEITQIQREYFDKKKEGKK